MTKSYYECHITMLGDPNTIRPHVESLKWKFSAIDGDPVLGAGIKCYATMFYNLKYTKDQVALFVYQVAEQLSKLGCNVIRRKVEYVIYDDRAASVDCSGACPECHLEDMV